MRFSEGTGRHLRLGVDTIVEADILGSVLPHHASTRLNDQLDLASGSGFPLSIDISRREARRTARHFSVLANSFFGVDTKASQDFFAAEQQFKEALGGIVATQQIALEPVFESKMLAEAPDIPPFEVM